ncbi:unnamed protein product [Owenia fusiformis]|nr:unnamed protein product [Owenia fusiformis]
MYSKCRIYNLNYSAISVDEMLATNYTNITTKTCDKWEYDRSVMKTTVMSEYDLVCEGSWLSSLAGTALMIGLFFGAISSGFLSDKFGRKVTTLAIGVLHIVSAFSAAFAPNYIVFLTLRTIAGMTAIGVYTPYWLLLIEACPPTHRGYMTILTDALLRVGTGSLALVAWLLRDHWLLQIIGAIGMVPGLILFVIFVPESPRWLISVGRVADAEAISRKIAKWNREEIPASFSLKQVEEKDDASSEKKGTFFDLFRTPNLRKYTLVVCSYWFACVFGNYAMDLNVGTLIPGSIFLNYLLMSTMVPLVSCISLFIGIQKIPRVVSLPGFLGVGGVMCIAMAPILLTNIPQLVTTVACIGRMLLANAFSLIYLYSGEIFPTPLRNVGLGAGSSFGRIGGLITPQIYLLASVWFGLPYVVLGGIPLGAALLSLMLPETRGIRLPENLSDGELFGTSAYEDITSNDRSGEKDNGTALVDSDGERAFINNAFHMDTNAKSTKPELVKPDKAMTLNDVTSL